MKTKILILGGAGMLGHCLFRSYAERDDLDVYATIRETDDYDKWFTTGLKKRLQSGIDVTDFNVVVRVMENLKPDVVINCVALVKQSQILADPLSAITINAQLPHRLASTCRKSGIRFIHISSDAVFDGKKGMYAENDKVNIQEPYGMTKFLGEVSYPGCVTVRTSIIGHGLVERAGLVDWFLSQGVKVRGYTKAIYSGFPTIELARIISDYILPNDSLSGIYHVSSEPISKYELLKMIADRYNKEIEIEPCDELVSDRSLDSSIFRSLTCYNPPSWPNLISNMHDDYKRHNGKA